MVDKKLINQNVKNNMVIIHHNKDMDGFCSGAICKLKYPDADLIGWDYKDEIPDFEQFRDKKVIMIDIAFPVLKCNTLSYIANDLVIIDHHISFKKEVDKINEQEDDGQAINFTYIYEADRAACEIGWKYLFPDKLIPYAITLIGRYDTWRKGEGSWVNETLPFKFYMYGQCNTAEGFPIHIFDYDKESIELLIIDGENIMKYQEMMDQAATRTYSFETTAYGLKALVLNVPYFNSESLKTKYDPELHDIMIGFCYTGTKWSVSLRSDKPNVDVSVIAKARGGGGHKGAAGFEVNSFSQIFE